MEWGDARCFLPLVLRPLPGASGAKLCDVASPYGYPGPLLETPPEWSEEERGAFLSSALDEGLRALQSRGVLTAFVRFNPLLPLPLEPFARRGEIVRHGNTVAVDLRLPDEEIRRQTRPNHRRGITGAGSSGTRSSTTASGSTSTTSWRSTTRP